MWRTPIGSQGRAKEGHQTVESEQQRGGTLNGQIRPLPLGLDPSMGAAFLEGRFQTPPLHEVAHQRFGRLCLVRRQEGLGGPFPCGIAREGPPNR